MSKCNATEMSLSPSLSPSPSLPLPLYANRNSPWCPRTDIVAHCRSEESEFDFGKWRRALQ